MLRYFVKRKCKCYVFWSNCWKKANENEIIHEKSSEYWKTANHVITGPVYINNKIILPLIFIFILPFTILHFCCKYTYYLCLELNRLSLCIIQKPIRTLKPLFYI
uniref:Uncharacterized protein n=1 Tax=Cacopsylla melanoneura TaxID=428564 RepID=A0A8D8L8R2_9HEMI